MFRIALYEVGVSSSPVGAFFNLSAPPSRDTVIDYEGRLWRVVKVIIHPHRPESRQFNTDAPVMTTVLVIPTKPPWVPEQSSEEPTPSVYVALTLEEFKELTPDAPLGVAVYEKSTGLTYVRCALEGDHQWTEM